MPPGHDRGAAGIWLAVNCDSPLTSASSCLLLPCRYDHSCPKAELLIRPCAGLSAPSLIFDGAARGPKVRRQMAPTLRPGQARRHTIFNSFSSLCSKLVFFRLCEQAHTHAANRRPRLFFFFFVRLIHICTPVEPAWPFFTSVRVSQSTELQPAGLIPIWSPSPDTGAITRF